MKWRVYNMHPMGLTHKEKFRDELIEIKANSFVLMDYEDAVQFRGQYFPIKMDAQNMQDPTTYKVIKIEPDDQAAKPEMKAIYVCHIDGKEFPSKSELEAYVQAKFGDLEPFRDESLEVEIQKTAAAAPAPKKRGPKPKETTL